MKVCRFRQGSDDVRIGLVTDDPVVYDLTPAGITHLHPLLEGDDPGGRLRQVAIRDLPRVAVDDVRLCAPVDRQEVWAAGVTYLRSKAARMEESDAGGGRFYDRVYDAERPELFFKALAAPRRRPGPARRGSGATRRGTCPSRNWRWCSTHAGRIVGYTIGNDMSSRDIEGENPLYLPQAKVYDRSCALGPWITLGVAEPAARDVDHPPDDRARRRDGVRPATRRSDRSNAASRIWSPASSAARRSRTAPSC